MALLISTFYSIIKVLNSRGKSEEWIKVIMAIYEKQMQIKNSQVDPTVLVTAFYKYLLEYADIFDADPNNNNFNLSADKNLKSSKKILDANSERYILSTSYARVSPFFPTPNLYLDYSKTKRESIADLTATKVDITNLLKSSSNNNTSRFGELSKDIDSYYYEILQNRSSLAKGKVASLNTNDNRMTELLFNSYSANEYYWGGDKCNVYVGDSLFYAFKKLYLSYTNDRGNDLDVLLREYLLKNNLLSGYYRYVQPNGIFKKKDTVKSSNIFNKCGIGSKIEPGYLVCFLNDDGSTYRHIEIVLSSIDSLQNGISYVAAGAHVYGVYRTTRTFDKDTMTIIKVKDDSIKKVLNMRN